MRILLSVIMCLCLTSCTYSSANLMRTQGGDVTVLGAWGFVRCINSSVTLYRSMDTTSEKKDDFPKIPTRPTISESGQAGQVNIGKPVKIESVSPIVPESLPMDTITNVIKK